MVFGRRVGKLRGQGVEGPRLPRYFYCLYFSHSLARSERGRVGFDNLPMQSLRGREELKRVLTIEKWHCLGVNPAADREQRPWVPLIDTASVGGEVRHSLDALLGNLFQLEDFVDWAATREEVTVNLKPNFHRQAKQAGPLDGIVSREAGHLGADFDQQQFFSMVE